MKKIEGSSTYILEKSARTTTLAAKKMEHRRKRIIVRSNESILADHRLSRNLTWKCTVYE